MRKCSICSHADSAAINKAIVRRDGTFRAIAERYGLTHTSVKRHHDGCLALKPKREPKATPAEKVGRDGALANVPDLERNDSSGELLSRCDVLAIVAKLVRLGARIASANEADLTTDAYVKLSKAVCSAAESHERIAGRMQTGSTNIIDARQVRFEQASRFGGEAELRAFRAYVASVRDASDNKGLSTDLPVIEGDFVEALPVPAEGENR